MRHGADKLKMEVQLKVNFDLEGQGQCFTPQTPLPPPVLHKEILTKVFFTYDPKLAEISDPSLNGSRVLVNKL